MFSKVIRFYAAACLRIYTAPSSTFITLPVMMIAQMLIFHPVLVSAETITPEPEIPAGFRLIDSARGVELYRKDFDKGNPDFVQVIDLSAGARLHLMHGEIQEPRPNKGDYGGPDPSMTSLLIESFWGKLRQIDENAFCVTNGLFFYMPEYPTRLAFPLKINGRLVTDGWGKNTYVGEQLILELWDDHAAIIPLTQAALGRSSAPNLIGGLTEEANKRAKFSVGRTFVGIDDRNSDGRSETILIFNTISATQSAAAETLKSFGADRIMMLDGGGSTQLVCRGGFWIRSDRPVPQAIGVIPAAEPQISSRVIGHSNWTVIIEGERLPLEIQIENTGVISWTPSATTFSIRTDRLEIEDVLPLPEVISPGASVTIRPNIPLPQRSGILPVDVGLTVEDSGIQYPAESIQIQAVVLPYSLQNHKRDLQMQISRWIISNPDETAKLVDQWIENELSDPVAPLEPEAVNPIRPVDITFIPLLMLPVMALIAWAIAHNRH